jgi:hypothetical protein
MLPVELIQFIYEVLSESVKGLEKIACTGSYRRMSRPKSDIKIYGNQRNV